MAEALVSKVVEELVSLAAQQIHHEFSLVTGSREKVGDLIRTFRAIQAVLVDAEKRQVTDKSVRLWLDNLKEVSYEMDAVLDEWNTAITLRSNLKLSGKVLFYSHACFHSNEVHRLGLRRRIACKIEGLNRKLENLSIEKERYTFSTQNVSSPVERKTISSVTVSEVYGRDAEKDFVVRELLCESSQVGRGYDIIAIVGTGGIGKTTLAQLVYNDNDIKAHFQLKIWVCVSDPFDVTTVARAIREAVDTSDARPLFELEALANRIRESIQGKKVFLVLDDVWTEERGKWEQLEECLKNCALGSKILVITRKVQVANMMGVESQRIISLQILSDDLCWSIFRRVAFFNKEDNKDLEGIGEQIAKKCKGLPLVAKTLGSLLRLKDTTEEWTNVLKSEVWELGDRVTDGDRVIDEVFVPLLLSYYDLSSLEKRCFLYCSYFPKDYEINRDALIQLWFSQGFFSKKKDEGESVGCFKNLVGRSLFQDFEKDDDGNIIGCKMHDIVHDFVMFLTKNECICELIKSEGKKMELVNVKAFHCTLVLEDKEAQIPESIYSNKSLRTLSVRKLGFETIIRWDQLLSLTCLRTLSLHDCGLTRLPKNIGKLIHLRYLSIRQGYLDVKLPKTIGNLVNLQTLDVRDSVRALPKSIGKLVNLRHLYLGKGDIILPKEVGKLNALETLDCVISISVESNASSKKKVFTLEDLSKLDRLKGSLRILIAEVKDVEEAERAQALRNKEGLVELSLHLYGTQTLESQSRTEVLLEGLEPPHQKLNRLEIRYFDGSRLFPSWMTKLVNLKTLKLSLCPNCEVLGAFGKLPSLESLRIEEMLKVKRVGVEFLGIEERGNNKMDLNCYSFPKLKQLLFSNFWGWEEWRGSDDDNSCCFTIMPSLVSLTFKNCYSLKPPLPAFLQKTPLQNLSIWDCPYLEQHHDQGGMKTEDRIKILTDTSLREANN